MLRWNPPPKEANLGEIHANYGVASAGTNITSEGVRGLNVGIGPKAEGPVGGSAGEGLLNRVAEWVGYHLFSGGGCVPW